MGMSIIFGQVAILFIFSVIGYVLVKTNIVDPRHAKILSVLAAYIFLPAKQFQSFANDFTVTYLTENYVIVLIGCAVLAGQIILAKLLTRYFSEDPYEKNVYEYSFVICNASYMGYVLAEALFESTMLLNIIFFIFPSIIYTYTKGYNLLTFGGKFSIKSFINPIFIATFLGSIWGLFSIPVPTVLNTFLTNSGNCIGPIAMLLLGISIGEQKTFSFLKDWRIYLMSVIRLILIPLAFSVPIYFIMGQKMALVSFLVIGMPSGLNPIIFPKLVGKDCRTGTGLALVSTILSLATIPVMISLLA